MTNTELTQLRESISVAVTQGLLSTGYAFAPSQVASHLISLVLFATSSDTTLQLRGFTNTHSAVTYLRKLRALAVELPALTEHKQLMNKLSFASKIVVGASYVLVNKKGSTNKPSISTVQTTRTSVAVDATNKELVSAFLTILKNGALPEIVQIQFVLAGLSLLEQSDFHTMMAKQEGFTRELLEETYYITQ